jgi:hypothetical protein
VEGHHGRLGEGQPVREKLAHVLNVCPRCLGSKKIRYLHNFGFKRFCGQIIRYRCKYPCVACGGSGNWTNYWVRKQRDEPDALAQALAHQLFMVKDAFWKETGEQYEPPHPDSR